MNHNLTADEALERLIEGNQRFQRGEPHLSGVARETLAELARGQHPFATILGCSDSRVSPEKPRGNESSKHGEAYCHSGGYR